MGRTGYTGQSIMLSDGLLLTAVPEGRSLLVNLVTQQVSALPSSSIAAERRNVSTSSVEGAVFAGVAHSGTSTKATPMTLPRYIRWLIRYHLFTAQTPALLRRGAQNLCAAGRRDLSEFVLRKADEETGHDRLALLDLEALGLPAAEVIRLIQPPSASVLVSKLREYVESPEPIALLGFSYCMERMTIEKDESFISSIDEICSPKSASQFLKVHSGMGNDRDHTDEQLALFETLDFDQLTIVARAAFETADTIATLDTIDQILSDDEIDHRLGICRQIRAGETAGSAFVMT
jgi:pyrroloquinoline quinone (PQQ) biosynthesis protein C